MLVQAHSMLREGGLCFLAVRVLDRIEVLSLTPLWHHIASLSLR